MHKQFQRSEIVHPAPRKYLSQNVQWLCPLQHKPIGFHDGDKECLLCGTDCVLKRYSLCFFCKGLKAEIVFKFQAKMVTSLVTYRKGTGQCVRRNGCTKAVLSGQLRGTSVLLPEERPDTSFV